MPRVPKHLIDELVSEMKIDEQKRRDKFIKDLAREIARNLKGV